MKIKHLHRWDVTYGEAVAIQEGLKEKLILHDEDVIEPIKTIAGADVSYEKRKGILFAAVVLLSWPAMDIIEEASSIEEVRFPYIPGLLTFREGPALLKAFEKLNHIPDAIIFDGQGIAHPRGIGLASHMGLFLDIPTVGCAKTRLIGSYGVVGDRVGDCTGMVYNNRLIGAVLRTREKVKPVFISQGHRIGLQRAVELVLSCCTGYRLPEPVRRAHLAVNRLRTGKSSSSQDSGLKGNSDP
ncbi:MAG: deoxyribonuclease V [Syntrophales bacterium]|nr:deoxyribonuclease V [Syntrophales bacterium]